MSSSDKIEPIKIENKASITSKIDPLPPVLTTKALSFVAADIHVDPDGTKTKQIQEQIEAMQSKMYGQQPE